MKYYTDGSSTIGIKSAYVVADEKGKVIKFEGTLAGLNEHQRPEYTNNEEEYRGVIAALNLCKEGDEIFTDSLLVVNQVRGAYKVKQLHLKPLCEEVKKLLSEKKSNLNWISREENPAGKHFE